MANESTTGCGPALAARCFGATGVTSPSPDKDVLLCLLFGRQAHNCPPVPACAAILKFRAFVDISQLLAPPSFELQWMRDHSRRQPDIADCGIVG